RLFTRELTARLTDVPDGELRAAVSAAAIVAAHNQALRRWLADGGRSEDVDACREHFRRVAPMLPLGTEQGLEDVTRRLERAARALEGRPPEQRTG
ncbi:MAG: TetR family transcriptional regulator, partial [Pseudonocardia sediminis]